tara:strand:- start:8305 stop:8499 length:195 start_codon:yes stop_codon:yes gene_type:complete
MSKYKQYIMTSVENQVDKIILQVKQNLISKSSAIKDILDIDNLEMVGIDNDNVDEVIELELENS